MPESATTPEIATIPSEPACVLVVGGEGGVAWLWTAPPGKGSVGGSVGAAPAAVPANASVVRVTCADESPIAAPPPIPKPMLVMLASDVCVPSALTSKVL